MALSKVTFELNENKPKSELSDKMCYRSLISDLI